MEIVERIVALRASAPPSHRHEGIVVTLLIALALVILVVYIFLQDLPATLIPLLAVPVGTVRTVPAIRFFHQHPFLCLVWC